MYVMTVVWPDGRITKTLASGWTPSECATRQSSCEARGCTVTFGYEVWR